MLSSTIENLSKKESLKYIKDYTNQLKYFAESGLIYFNWQPVDGYLNDLLYKLIPDSLKNVLDAKIFVKKDITNNAISMPNGHIYINVGLLANLKSEAALAFVIAHELAHYLNKHHIKNYKQTLQNERKYDTNFYRFTHNNKHLEIEADVIAIDLLKEQGMPFEDAIEVFELLQSNGETHKLNRMREFFVKKQIGNYTKKTHQLNQHFDEVSHLSKDELFRILLNENQYVGCLKLGLRSYDQNNYNNSTYFIAEAIRRYLLLHPNDANETIEQILVSNEQEVDYSVDSVNLDIHKKKLKTIFKELTSFNNKLKNSELYFAKALHDTTHLEKNDLKSYLQKEKPVYALLAKYLINNKHQDLQIQDTKPVILVDVFKSFKQCNNMQQVDFEKQSQLNTIIFPKLKQLLYAKYSGHKIVFIKDLIEVDFNIANKLQTFFNTSDTTLIDNPQLLFYLKPEAFELFHLLQTTSIQYMQIEAKEGLKNYNNNVINPINLISKLTYLLKEKNTYSIKKIEIVPNEVYSVQKSSTKSGRVRLNKVLDCFEELLN